MEFDRKTERILDIYFQLSKGRVLSELIEKSCGKYLENDK